jgi:hypothetical protein
MPLLDFGWNWGGAGGFVTDQLFCTHSNSGDNYPHGFTNGNGQTITGGWDSTLGGQSNIDATNDPRLAGYVNASGSKSTFRVDLASGSGDGAGDYLIDIAVGWAFGSANNNSFKVRDNTTDLISQTDISVAGDTYLDATKTAVAATTMWTGTRVIKTFASTTCFVDINWDVTANASVIAHFRLTFVPAPSIIPRSLMPPIRAA